MRGGGSAMKAYLSSEISVILLVGTKKKKKKSTFFLPQTSEDYVLTSWLICMVAIHARWLNYLLCRRVSRRAAGRCQWSVWTFWVFFFEFSIVEPWRMQRWRVYSNSLDWITPVTPYFIGAALFRTLYAKVKVFSNFSTQICQSVILDMDNLKMTILLNLL